MTDTTAGEGVREIIETLEALTKSPGTGEFDRGARAARLDALDMLRPLAAQPSAGAQGEAVAWRWKLLGSWAYTDSPGRAKLERSLGETLYPLYATPTQPDTGYTDAFYQLAEMMGLPATPHSPKHMWEMIMRPRLQDLLAQPDTGDMAALREAVALVIQRHDNDKVPENYASGMSEDVSDWSAYLADHVLAALSKPNAQGVGS